MPGSLCASEVLGSHQRSSVMVTLDFHPPFYGLGKAIPSWWETSQMLLSLSGAGVGPSPGSNLWSYSQALLIPISLQVKCEKRQRDDGRSC